jgi:hypothetical protein
VSFLRLATLAALVLVAVCVTATAAERAPVSSADWKRWQDARSRLDPIGDRMGQKVDRCPISETNLRPWAACVAPTFRQWRGLAGEFQGLIRGIAQRTPSGTCRLRLFAYLDVIRRSTGAFQRVLAAAAGNRAQEFVAAAETLDQTGNETRRAKRTSLAACRP